MGHSKFLFVTAENDEETSWKQRTVEEEFICSACDQVLDCPKILRPCQHLVCSSCVPKNIPNNTHNTKVTRGVTRERPKCPVTGCEKKVTSSQEPMKQFVSLLNKLKIKCPHSPHKEVKAGPSTTLAKGCTTVVSLRDFQDHDDLCEFNPENNKKCDGCGTILTGQIRQSGHDCLEILKKKLEEAEKAKEELIASQQLMNFNASGSGSAHAGGGSGGAGPPAPKKFCLSAAQTKQTSSVKFIRSWGLTVAEYDNCHQPIIAAIEYYATTANRETTNAAKDPLSQDALEASLLALRDLANRTIDGDLPESLKPCKVRWIRIKRVDEGMEAGEGGSSGGLLKLEDYGSVRGMEFAMDDQWRVEIHVNCSRPD